MGYFYRSRKDKKLFGLCGGLAEKFNVDPTLVRLVVVVTGFFSAGTVVAVYLIAGMVIPLETGGGNISGYGGAYGNSGPVENHGTSGYGWNDHKLDEMMKGIEDKALREELAELRAKLAHYEKGES